MLDLIRSLSHGKGVSVLVSSHLLPDIERVCDQVVVVFQGELRAQGMIKDLKKIEGHPVDVELREANAAFVNEAVILGARLISVKSQSYRLQTAGTPDQAARLVFEAARKSGAQIRGFDIAERSLEEAFLEVVHG